MGDFDLNAVVAVYNGTTIHGPTIKEFTGRYVDIRRFGVQPGVLETTQIQNAFDSAAGEVAIWFPPGLEFNAGPLMLPSNLVLRGAGIHSLLIFPRSEFGTNGNALTEDGKRISRSEA